MRLTAAQYEIWEQQRQLASTAMLNIAEYVEIRGAIRVELLTAAIRATVGETEALTMRFRDTEDGPRQEPADVDREVQVVDLREDANPLAAAREWMAADVATDLCVYNDRLFAHAVFLIDADTTLWYHRVHHILLDGYGLVLFARRVAQVYTALAMGATPPPVNFGSLAAVVEHDRADLDSENYARAAEFWLDYERDRPAPVGPAGRTAPLSPRMTRVHHDLPPDLVTALRAQRTATSAEAIIAGIAAYLHRVTGAPQVSLALPVMMRVGTPALRVPTMTVNAIHCWTTFTPVSTFADITTQVSTHLRTSRPHHRYRYGDLLRRLVNTGGDRRISGPSVNVMPFDFGLRFAESPGTVRNVAAGVEEDIAFRLYDYGDAGIRLVVDGNPNLYGHGELEAHARRPGVFLARLLADPDRALSHLPLVDAADAALLRTWRERETARRTPSLEPTAADDDTVVAMLWSRVRRTPERVAVVDRAEAITVAQLGARVEALAAQLRARGVGPGSVVLLVLPRTVDAVVALFATAAAGAAYVAADPNHPAGHVEFLRADSGADVLLSAVDRAAVDDRPASPGPQIRPDYPVCLTYTSGSTGTPKGAWITHRGLVNLARQHRRLFIPDERHPRRAALTASFCFDTSWEGLFWLLNGHELHIVSEEVRSAPEELLAYVDRHRIDFLDTTPTQAEQLVAAGLLAPGAYRPGVLALGGEAVGQALWSALREAPDIDVYNLYGPSEATVDATWARLADSASPVIGTAVAGVRCEVLDGRLRPVPPGVPGELYLAGDSLALGYHRRPGLTATRFLADPDGPPGARRYRTGDRVRRLLDGTLEYLWRTDDQVNLAGVRIEPAGIEAALATHPRVTSAACTVVDDRLVGYVVTTDPRPRPADLRRHLFDLVPRYLVPSLFVTVDRMPTTVTGKLDRAALPRPAATGAVVRPPRDEVERLLCALFAEVLGVPDIGIDDDFFALGGDSAMAVRVAARIREALSVAADVRTIFETATVAELAAELDANRTRLQPVPDLEADARLEADLRVESRAAEAHGAPTNILLTGATGFLGGFLLAELLARPDTRVTCLIRGNTGPTRLRQALSQSGIRIDWDRVTVITGDLAHPGLGLNADIYRALAESVDAVVHNGAPVNHLTPYARLRPGIVEGTREVLRLAALRGTPVHYISTCDTAVASDHNPELVLERRRAPAAKVLANGYIQAKWVAEGLVLAAGERGLPVAVHRPGLVCGHSVTGVGNGRDAFWSLVRTMVLLGVEPDRAELVNLVPVDHVAGAVAHLVHLGRTGVYHHTVNEMTSLTTILARLRAHGYHLSPMPEHLWLERLPRLGAAGEQARALLDARPPAPRQSIRFDRTNADNALRDTAIPAPLVDDRIIDACLRFFQRTGFLPAPDSVSVA
ncbi:thioester reductase domain-containing protein [Nocardia sp. CDC153]|uniref:thioester reductase domain-containing protein n=1 Tax=Nocardia sp. CDC153 TaxID=3112167 RepID=UPI002DBC3040|nr:thioester reductase domain-containing protein [Nocardia sp. CDC153]MEC3954107.1 thioester reductase domain-containing protein [Nocardia sp. CDC153]